MSPSVLSNTCESPGSIASLSPRGQRWSRCSVEPANAILTLQKADSDRAGHEPMMQANYTVPSIVLSNYESYDTPADLVTSFYCIVVSAITLGTVIPTLLGG